MKAADWRLWLATLKMSVWMVPARRQTDSTHCIYMCVRVFVLCLHAHLLMWTSAGVCVCMRACMCVPAWEGIPINVTISRTWPVCVCVCVPLWYCPAYRCLGPDYKYNKLVRLLCECVPKGVGFHPGSLYSVFLSVSIGFSLSVSLMDLLSYKYYYIATGVWVLFKSIINRCVVIHCRLRHWRNNITLKSTYWKAYEEQPREINTLQLKKHMQRHIFVNLTTSALQTLTTPWNKETMQVADDNGYERFYWTRLFCDHLWLSM